MTNEITPKQQRFVDEYLLDMNAKQAAIRAGYSENTAESQGSRLLSKAKVLQAVKTAQDARSERTQIDADWVLKQAAHMYKKCEGEDDNGNALKALDLCGKHNQVKAFAEEAAAPPTAPTIVINVPVNPDA